jgi:hypothetical protein
MIPNHLDNFVHRQKVQSDLLWRIQSDLEFLMEIKEYNKKRKLDLHLYYLAILTRNDMILLTSHLISQSSDEYSFTKSIKILGHLKKTFSRDTQILYSNLLEDLNVIRALFKELSFVDIRNTHIAHIDRKRVPYKFEWAKAEHGIGLLFKFYNDMSTCVGKPIIARKSAIDLSLFIRQDKSFRKISDFALNLMKSNYQVGSDIIKQFE